MSLVSGIQSLKCSHSEISVTVEEDLAELKLTQVFDPSGQVEADYSFQLTKDSVISQLLIRSGQNLIMAEVQEKESALEAHSDQMSSGKTSFLGMVEDSDHMSFHVGNMDPSQPTTVELTYIITSVQYQNTLILSVPVRSLVPGMPSSLSIRISMSSPITLIFHSNLIPSNLQPNVVLLENPRIENDVLVEYTCEDLHKPIIMRQKDQRTNKEAVYLSYYPPKREVSITEWDPSGEFIILVDRSGSMSGQKIKLAREACELFVRSLPSNSYFNVVSFGSCHQLMFNQSVKYSTDALQQACSSINKMDSNLGGTNIIGPLRDVLSKPSKPGYPLYVFLITDGCVMDRVAVIDYVNQHKDKAKVSSIGIGRDADQLLVQKVAEVGNGTSQIVLNNEDIKKSVIGSLRSVLIPGFTDIAIANSDDFEVVGPIEPFYIFAGGRIHLGAVLKENTKTPLKIRYKDELCEEYSEDSFEIPQESSNNSAAVILTVGKALDELEQYQAVDVSVKYQVLCKHTAFLGLIKNSRPIKVPYSMNSNAAPSLSGHILCSMKSDSKLSQNQDVFSGLNFAMAGNSAPPPAMVLPMSAGFPPMPGMMANSALPTLGMGSPPSPPPMGGIPAMTGPPPPMFGMMANSALPTLGMGSPPPPPMGGIPAMTGPPPPMGGMMTNSALPSLGMGSPPPPPMGGIPAMTGPPVPLGMAAMAPPPPPPMSMLAEGPPVPRSFMDQSLPSIAKKKKRKASPTLESGPTLMSANFLMKDSSSSYSERCESGASSDLESLTTLPKKFEEEEEKEGDLIRIKSNSEKEMEVKTINQLKFGSDSQMRTIISLQAIDGHWDRSSELESVLRSLLENDINFDRADEPTLTALVIAVLKLYFANRAEEIELIVGKALRWLRKKGSQEDSLQNIMNKLK